MLIAVAVAALIISPCSLWTLVPAIVVGAVPATVVARKVWKARKEVFAAPGMLVVVYAFFGLGAFGLWLLLVALRCLGPGALT